MVIGITDGGRRCCCSCCPWWVIDNGLDAEEVELVDAIELETELELIMG